MVLVLFLALGFVVTNAIVFQSDEEILMDVLGVPSLDDLDDQVPLAADWRHKALECMFKHPTAEVGEVVRRLRADGWGPGIVTSHQLESLYHKSHRQASIPLCVHAYLQKQGRDCYHSRHPSDGVSARARGDDDSAVPSAACAIYGC